jgi:hypothetical protein
MQGLLNTLKEAALTGAPENQCKKTLKTIPNRRRDSVL